MKNSWWLLSAVLASVVLVLLVNWTSDSTDKVPSSTDAATISVDYAPITLQWLNGVAQQYHILSNSSMHMQAAAQGASDINVHLSAQLDTLTLNAENNEEVVGMRLSSVELTINGIIDTDTNDTLSTPFRVRFTTDGMPLAFEFPEEIAQQNRTILENIIRTFQLSLNSSDEWTENESNGMGIYKATYQRTGPSQFKKSKQQFNAVAEGMVNWSEISSEESFNIDMNHNWIDEMVVVESMNSHGQVIPGMQVDNHATLKRQHGVQLSLSPRIWDFIAVSTETIATMTKKKRPNLSIEKARNQILVTIPELNEATEARLSHIYRLRDLLQVDDSLPALILNALKTQELNDRTKADLYLALELTGTDSAQAALVEVITGDSWSLKDGMRAIVAMGGVQEPTPDSVTALWEMAQYTAGDERQRMANSATFALGSVGNTMNKADNPEYSTLRSNLLSNAFSGGDTHQRSNYITALGNTHDATLANDVVVFLDDIEPAIRRAAALSLGSLDTDQIADKLISHYQTEDNGYVRGAIAESLKTWNKPTDSAMAVFRQTVLIEKDESTRYNVAQILSKNLKNFPENKSVLREIMRKEPSKRIRQKVANALSKQ